MVHGVTGKCVTVIGLRVLMLSRRKVSSTYSLIYVVLFAGYMPSTLHSDFQSLQLNDETTEPEGESDPFTAKLMSFEVRSLAVQTPFINKVKIKRFLLYLVFEMAVSLFHHDNSILVQPITFKSKFM